MSDSPHFIKLPRTIVVDEDVGSEERENKKAQVPAWPSQTYGFLSLGQVGYESFLSLQPNTHRTITSVTTQTPQHIDFL